jgi:hypothetical protein
MARTKRLSHSNIIRPLCGLIYGEYLTLVLDVTEAKEDKISPLNNDTFIRKMSARHNMPLFGRHSSYSGSCGVYNNHAHFFTQ